MRNQGSVLRALFRAAVEPIRPDSLIERHVAVDGDELFLRAGGRILRRLPAPGLRLVAAGKAACGMACSLLAKTGPLPLGGVVAAPASELRSVQPSTRPGPSRRTRGGGRVRWIPAEHPVPDRGSLEAGRAVWKLLGGCRHGDEVLLLLSGGASSLLVLPAAGISLTDKMKVTRLLLVSGARIGEINAVRKHLSRLKGGGLARRAQPARVTVLALSDVPGNDPSTIGSGPAATDRTTFRDAWRILERYGLPGRIPAAVRRRFERGLRGEEPETLKPGEPGGWTRVVGDVRTALDGAAREARRRGYRIERFPRILRGDTEREACRWAEAILRAPAGTCLLAGGETTVRVRGPGKGGRNQEFALVVAREIAGRRHVACLSAGTDGVDGPTDAAGAFVDGTTIRRARRKGLEPENFLDRNDSYRFFEDLGDLFRPGPTGTNVTDAKIALVG